MPIRRPRALDELEAQQAQAAKLAEGASALGGVGMAATLSGPHYAAALADPDLIPRVAEAWPSVGGAKEQARLEAVGEGRPDYSALDVAKAYGLQGLGAVGQGLERSVSDLPGGRFVQANMEEAWQQAERANVPQALQTGADLLAPGMHELAMIPAFHGTPHMFDAFRFDRIGTGEGAQAFGHGLYFAENPAIARSYARDLATESGAMRVNGQTFDPEIPDHASAQWIDWEQTSHAKRQAHKGPKKRTELSREKMLERAKSERAQVMDELREMDEVYQSGPGPEFMDEYTAFEREAAELDNTIAMLKGDHPLPKYTAPEGQVYSVELDFDHDDLLDWDVMLEDMSPATRSKIEKAFEGPIGGVQPAEALKYIIKPTNTGQQIYRRLSQLAGGDEAASAALSRAGVPGLRYLDNPSRGRTAAKGLVNPDGTKYQVRGQTEIDVAAGATNYGSLDKFVEETERTLSRYEGAKLSNGMAVSDQALGELEARLNVARRMRVKGQVVGTLPKDRNIVAFSDEGIEVLSRTPESKMRGPSY